MLLGRIFIKLKFSKPKIIWFLSKAKSIISKPVAMVYRDVGLSNHLKYVAILVSLLLFLFFPRIGLMSSHRWLPVGFWVLASVVFALGAEVRSPSCSWEVQASTAGLWFLWQLLVLRWYMNSGYLASVTWGALGPNLPQCYFFSAATNLPVLPGRGFWNSLALFFSKERNQLNLDRELKLQGVFYLAKRKKKYTAGKKEQAAPAGG